MTNKTVLRVAAAHGGPVIPSFGVVLGESPLLAVAEQHLAQRAFMVIIESPTARDDRTERFDALTSAVDAHFVEGLTGGGVLMDVAHIKRLTRDRTPDDFAMLAWQAYVKSHLSWCERLQVSKVIVPFAVRPTAGLAEQVVLDAGGTVLEAAPARTTGLDRAWAVAKMNVERADFRLAALHTLMAAARGRSEELQPTAHKQGTALARRLWNDRQVALMNLFAVGTLVGEAAQVELKARAKAMFAGRASVMQLVSDDGVHPTNWCGGDEEQLREQIARA